MDDVSLYNRNNERQDVRTMGTRTTNEMMVSELIQKFDGYDDDGVYDDIFKHSGQRDNIDHEASVHSDHTKRHDNLSSRVVAAGGGGGGRSSRSRSSNNGGGFGGFGDDVDITSSSSMLQKLKSNKYMLLAILVILTITFTSSSVSKNKLLYDDSEYYSTKGTKGGWNEKHYGGGDDNNLMFDGQQHDQGEHLFSDSSGGFTYYHDENNMKEDDNDDEENEGDKEEQDDEVTDLITTGGGIDDLQNKNDDGTQHEYIPTGDGYEPIHSDIDMEILQSRFSDVEEPYQSASELPFLMFVAGTGAALQEESLLKCHGLIAASGKGDTGDIDVNEPNLKVVVTPDNKRYVNVDLQDPEGVQRAVNLKLVGSGLAQLVVAQRINPVSEIFHSPFKGKCFILMRHPVERAESVFYALKDSNYDHVFKKEFKDMTISDYAFSPYLESNWLTRILIDKMDGQLDDSDLDNAKSFLSNKCLIGLTEKMDESNKRFMKYFGWLSTNNPVCEDELKQDYENDTKKNDRRKKIPKKVYNHISDLNILDIKLYEYAMELFEEQKSLLSFL